MATEPIVWVRTPLRHSVELTTELVLYRAWQGLSTEKILAFLLETYQTAI